MCESKFGEEKYLFFVDFYCVVGNFDRNSAAFNMGMLRKGCKDNKSLSPVTIAFALTDTARYKYISSLGSRHASICSTGVMISVATSKTKVFLSEPQTQIFIFLLFIAGELSKAAAM